MPTRVLLEHFQHCISQTQQLAYLANLIDLSSQGAVCRMGCHAAAIANQAEYTGKLLTGIREVLDELADAGDAPTVGPTGAAYLRLLELVS